MKKILRYLSTVIAVAVLAAVFAAPAYAVSFSDFSDAQTHWAAPVLKRAVSDGVLSGSGSELKPDGTLTGSEMSAILVRYLDLQIWTEPYLGTTSGEWYYRYAAIAKYAGILPESGDVSMTKPVTREQAFKSFVDGYGIDASSADTSVLSRYSDSAAFSTAEYSRDAALLISKGIISGNDKSQIQPQSSITRAEFVKILYAITDAGIRQGSSGSGTAVSDTAKNPSDASAAAGGTSDASAAAGGTSATATDTTAATAAGTSAAAVSGGSSVTSAAAARTSPLDGVKIVLSASDVSAGNPLKASMTLKGLGTPIVGSAVWYLDGTAVTEYSADTKDIYSDMKSDFSKAVTYSRYMDLTHNIGLEITYISPSDGITYHLYTQKTVKVTNYADSYYQPSQSSTGSAAGSGSALTTVSSVYSGNYTSVYNVDYSKVIKQGFVNSNGYSSRTDYLVWVNLGTQKVNVFLGSTGNWQLIKTMRCASGSPSTPTPTGVSYVTKKEPAGWTTASYTCKPVMRFYPGTGYAFHSILYYPGTTTVKDGSIGFPASHGCIRMLPADIGWLYNYVPVKTTVVIY